MGIISITLIRRHLISMVEDVNVVVMRTITHLKHNKEAESIIQLIFLTTVSV